MNFKLSPNRVCRGKGLFRSFPDQCMVEYCEIPLILRNSWRNEPKCFEKCREKLPCCPAEPAGGGCPDPCSDGTGRPSLRPGSCNRTIFTRFLAFENPKLILPDWNRGRGVFEISVLGALRNPNLLIVFPLI